MAIPLLPKARPSCTLHGQGTHQPTLMAADVHVVSFPGKKQLYLCGKFKREMCSRMLKLKGTPCVWSCGIVFNCCIMTRRT